MSVVIKNLKKTFDIDVLKDISLEVSKGQILGIIGRSGAGKSTLLRCLNGLEQPTAGAIMIDGMEFSTATGSQKQHLQQKIGTIFQNFNLLSRLTALENVMFPLRLRDHPVKESRLKALRMMDLVGLAGKEQAYPRQLSGGQCQRIAIARALIQDVSLLLCDEFTSALDPETTLDILALLRRLNQQLGVSIILITHDMEIIREICDDVCVLEDGSIVEKNDIASILLHPQHATTQSLIRNLFKKDVPPHLQDNLSPVPTPQGSALLRLLFSSQSAHRPIISSLAQKYQISINIVFGNLDHVRQRAFGCLIVALDNKTSTAILNNILQDLEEWNVSTEILGYLPFHEAL